MLPDLRAVHTGELGPNVPDDLEMPRHKVEHLRAVFAEPAHSRATLGTMAALRWMHYCPARQIGRQRTRCARFTLHPSSAPAPYRWSLRSARCGSSRSRAQASPYLRAWADRAARAAD